MSDRHRTIRLQVTEVYEKGHDFPLFICSDPTMARENADSTDRIVNAWWVREGNDGEVSE